MLKKDYVTVTNGVEKRVEFTLEGTDHIRIKTWVDGNKVHNMLLTMQTAQRLSEFVTRAGAMGKLEKFLTRFSCAVPIIEWDCELKEDEFPSAWPK